MNRMPEAGTDLFSLNHPVNPIHHGKTLSVYSAVETNRRDYTRHWASARHERQQTGQVVCRSSRHERLLIEASHC